VSIKAIIRDNVIKFKIKYSYLSTRWHTITDIQFIDYLKETIKDKLNQIKDDKLYNTRVEKLNKILKTI
jgi:hypothetical protein